MGIVQASGSSGKLTSTAWIAGMDEMADETGLRCVVCDEGYINKPGELMGVYCYSRNTDLRCTVSAEQKVSDVAFNRLCLIKHISDSLASPRSLISMSSTTRVIALPLLRIVISAHPSKNGFRVTLCAYVF